MAEAHNCTSSANGFIALVVALAMSYLMTWDFEKYAEEKGGGDRKMITNNMVTIWITFLLWFAYNIVSRRLQVPFVTNVLDSIINGIICMLPIIVFTIIDLKLAYKPTNMSTLYINKRRTEKAMVWIIPLSVYIMLEWTSLSVFFCKQVIGKLEGIHND